MKSKYSGKCSKTGRRFGVGANVKWLGRGKGCILIDDDTSAPADTHRGDHCNDAGEPLYNPRDEWKGAEYSNWESAHDACYDR